MNAKKIISLGVVLAMTLSMFVSCSSSTTASSEPAASKAATSASSAANSAESSKAESAASEAAGDAAPERTPAQFDMLCLFDGNEPPVDNEAYRKIAEYTQVELKYIWAPGGGSYNEKVNTLLASGDLPTFFLVTDNKLPTVLSAVQGGAFWDLTDYIPQYEHLNSVNPNIYYNLSLEGRSWFIPRTRPIVKDGIIYRKDWLENLGLEEPKNLDELYEVLRAFTEDDPDGNGKKDTYGLADLKGLNRFRYLVCAIGGVNEHGFIDGEIVFDHEQPEYKQVLDFYRKLYQNGYMNQDFPLIELAGIWEKVNKNEAGMIFSDPEQITYFEELKKIVPTATFDTFATLGADRSKLSAGFNGGFAITKNGAKSEEELKRALLFLDDLCSDTVQNLFVWGVEGTHYTMKDGKAMRTEEQNSLYQNEVYRWERALRIRDINEAIPGILSPEQEAYQTVVKETTDKLIPNDCITFTSPTWSTEGPTLNQIINDARTQYIMGEIDEAGWEAAVAQWRASGGDQVKKEYTELYNAQHQ